MIKLPLNAALLIIDVQQGFDDPKWGSRNNPDAEANIAQLLGVWRESRRPIFHIRHMSTEPNSPLRPGQLGNAFKAMVTPQDGEPIIEKAVNSAFIGTSLEEALRAAAIDTLVLTGLTTDHCVSTTARMAANLGFRTYIAEDATATFERISVHGTHYSAEQMHESALTSLNGEFATIVPTQIILDQAQTLP